MSHIKTNVHWIAAGLACAVALIGACAVSPVSAGHLLAYAPPPVPLVYTAHNDDFTVRVREPGGEWHDLYEYKIRVDWDRPQDASMVYFDFDGSVEVEVEKNNGKFSDVSVLPGSEPITLVRHGNSVRFVLTKPDRFSLQFDDDRLHNLHIVSGTPPVGRAENAGVRYFGPGLHVPDDGTSTFPIKSGDTLYLDGGAILQGNFVIDGLHDVRILGRGLIYNSGKALEINRSQNIEIDDLISVNDDTQPAARIVNVRHSANVTLNGLTGFTSGKWSDGINISTSQHVLVNGAYLRTSDDAVVVYAVNDCPICAKKTDAEPSPLSLDTFDIKVENSTLWADVAHAMYVGHFGDLTHPRNIYDVTFKNIDVLNLDEDDPAWEGVMAVFSGDATLIRNVTFEDIRVKRIEEGKLFNIIVGNNPRYNKAPGAGVDGVTLRNIDFTGDGLPSASIFSGLSDGGQVKNVIIDNLKIGGKKIKTLDDFDVLLGPYVAPIAIK